MPSVLGESRISRSDGAVIRPSIPDVTTAAPSVARRDESWALMAIAQ
jgi:hypothetical protein